MRKILTILFCFFTIHSFSQDTLLLKVHFLYGSKPSKKYKSTEQKWFGGKWGGHVGIESENNQILNFAPRGKFHWIEKPKNKHSNFAIHSTESFYQIMGNVESAKKTIFYIPISKEQKSRFDSIAVSYQKTTPYDYAFIGMRCGAAAYDVLAQLDIVPSYNRRKTAMKIFYPRKLRNKLFKKAITNGWTIIQENGSERRKWEKR